MFLASIFVLVLPLMIAAILMGASNKLQPIAIWIAGISPLTLPALSAAHHLSIADFPMNFSRAIPGAYIFWQSVYLLTAIALLKSLWNARCKIQSKVTIEERKDIKNGNG